MKTKLITLSRRLLNEPDDEILLPEKFSKEYRTIVLSEKDSTDFDAVFKIVTRTLGKFEPHIYSKENTLLFLDEWEEKDLTIAVKNFATRKTQIENLEILKANKHFIISFINYRNKDESSMIAEKEDVIYDTQKFDEILNLWKPYLKDFQSLFDYHEVAYKTSPHIDFKRKDDFAKPFLTFVKQFTPSNNKYDCFTISFPKDIIN